MYLSSTRCETTRAPGFAQARFNYQAAGACDCPSHLMKAHLPSSRQHWSLSQLFALSQIPDSNCILPGPTRYSHNNNSRLSLTRRFCSSCLCRRLSPQPGACLSPSWEKKNEIAGSTPNQASLHTPRLKEATLKGLHALRGHSTVVIPRLFFLLLIS
ncbi:hypothetical protein M441DRAFT_458178 [Trichoderma asperellum CBS 433.97]|uniref:Uncharacterized protein n=1 Tax=Trichoderma asperellum (strain ATCC 204424 / CBS 433.97 / NBRC 101777) TaxID=1042311 RepID=A0A2T3Z763_TRIA4|nr:hypothetical protein M441DRAFT_458178 [Trichoderma asperellum CBS 433.97]PTB40649.1 hypothetical protein M441DRAFT_458178 [Trichoderma asperellum CBS 433.97]